MKWTPQSIIALILSMVVVLALIGTFANNLILGQKSGINAIEWWGKILFAIVGGLLLYLGLNSNNNDK